MTHGMDITRFGLSTHLFHGERLERRHIDTAAASGFRLLEIFATRTHFDYHASAAVDGLRGWLADAGVELWSLHAPITDAFTGGRWGQPLSNASPHPATRDAAVTETLGAIEAAAALGCSQVVLHLGIPSGQPIPPGDNDAAAVARSLETLATASQAAGVTLALEVIPNALATTTALLSWLDPDRELGPLGVCLDTGHAHLMDGAPEAIEQLAGYITTTHLHDNRGRDDAHLVPFDGTVDWAATLMAFCKVGYGGPFMLELPDHGDAARTLERAVAARRRLQAILDDLSQPFTFDE